MMEVWHYVGEQGEPPFENGAYNKGGSEGSSVRFKRVGDQVFLAGLAKVLNNNSVIFTLPEGFRPPEHCILPIVKGSSSMARLDIRTNGEVAHMSPTAGYASLTGVSFFVN